jgi:hypothetical protein
MPINSINDIDSMLDNYRQSQAAAKSKRTFSDPVRGYWVSNSQSGYNVNETYSRSTSSSSESSSSGFMSRFTRVFSPRDVVDEHGNFNSSRQLIK